MQTSLSQWTSVFLLEKPLHCSFVFFVFFSILQLSHSFNSSLSLMLQYADLHIFYFPHLSSCASMQNIPICQQCASGSSSMHFLNQFSMRSHKGCCLDVTRTNLPGFCVPCVGIWAHQSKCKLCCCLMNDSHKAETSSMNTFAALGLWLLNESTLLWE